MLDSKSDGVTTTGGTSQWQVLRFYIPLAIQALSQSLTYPLVASIVSHGKFGSTELAAFAQGQALMFVFGAIGGGLITTGMVFGRTQTGMRNFHKRVMRIAAAVGILQFIVCLPPLHHVMFERILGLEGELASVARFSMLLGIPMQLGFFIRNKYLVPLYNEKRSGLANTATMVRVSPGRTRRPTAAPIQTAPHPAKQARKKKVGMSRRTPSWAGVWSIRTAGSVAMWTRK